MKTILYTLVVVVLIFAVLVLLFWNKNTSASEITFQKNEIVVPLSFWNKELPDIEFNTCSNISFDVKDGRIFGMIIKYSDRSFDDIKKCINEKFGTPYDDENDDGNIAIWRLNSYGTAMQLSISEDSEPMLILLPLK